MINKSVIIFIVLLGFILCAQEGNANNKSSVKIVVHFSNQQVGASSGFLIRKGDRFFVVMTTHCLHTYQQGWFPDKLDIYVDNGKYDVEISKNEYEIYHAHHKENMGEYIDTTTIELTNIQSLKQLKQDIGQYFLDYSQLAEKKDIDSIDGSESVFIYSIYGAKRANLGERMPWLSDTQQTLYGFQINNCTPALNQKGGDSGGLILFRKYSTDLIVGMILKREKYDETIGYAVDSIRVKETIDMRK